MGVLRMVPKTRPLQFVPVPKPKGLQLKCFEAKVIEIVLGSVTVRVPDGSDPDTLKQVIRILRAP